MGVIENSGWYSMYSENTGVGKMSHSVFDGLFTVPIFISRPNWVKWSDIRVNTLTRPALYLKTNEPLSIKSMKISYNIMSYSKVIGR